MSGLGGLGKSSREKLSKLNRAFMDTPFSVSDALLVLGLSSTETSRLMSSLTNQGWAHRIKRGHYFLIPIEASDPAPIVEDPWFAAANLFSPCYISGWSAAEHWGFTEQIFRSVFVVTAKKIKKRAQSIGGIEFVLRTVMPELIFGTKIIWKGKVKAHVADPSKLIIDLLDSPESGGGIGHVIQIFKSYLKSEHQDIEKLLQYATKQSSGAIFKRLGLLLEKLAPTESSAIQRCKKALSSGYSMLDPKLKSDKIITRWKLWIPSFVERDFSE